MCGKVGAKANSYSPTIFSDCFTLNILNYSIYFLALFHVKHFELFNIFSPLFHVKHFEFFDISRHCFTLNIPNLRCYSSFRTVRHQNRNLGEFITLNNTALYLNARKPNRAYQPVNCTKKRACIARCGASLGFFRLI